MPYNRAQVKLAQAVSHGFKPTGSASGFSKGFATQVLEESGKAKKKRGTLGDLTSLKMGK